MVAGVAGAFLAAQFTDPGSPPLGALTLGWAAALLAALAWGWTAPKFGPRHHLDIVLPLAALVLLVLAVREPLGLPRALFLLTHPLLLASLTMAWLGTYPAPGAGGLAGGVVDGAAAVAGAGLWALAVIWLGLGAGLAMLILSAVVLVAWWLIWPIPDPIHPGRGPLAPYLPWTKRAPRPWPAWTKLPARAPAVLGYLVVSWALFLTLGEPRPGGYGLDTQAYHAWLYHIPELSHAPLEAVGSLFSATMLNHDHVQIIYVTCLLLLFGLAFEVREGTPRAIGIFAITGLVGALVAGVVLHGLVAAWPDVAFIDKAWTRTWSGGSVGAFGLMGALAARARRPAPLLGFFVFWELNVGAWFLRSYTPMFHLTALATGFLITRHLLSNDAPERHKGHKG